jgi:hypothetical protein
MKRNRFTTSGLKRHDGTIQRKTQPVTRLNFPQIRRFEILYLISKSKYLGLSQQHQDILRKEIERSFFAWMMEKRKDGKTTTPLVKEMMYKSIAEKHLALIEEDGPGLFDFLSGGSAPAFPDFLNLGFMGVGGEEDKDEMTPSPVLKFYHTGLGVIPSLPNNPPIMLRVPELFCMHKESVSIPTQFPFLELFDSPLNQSDFPSFPAVSMTFPPAYSDEEIDVADSGTEIMWKRENFLQRFDNPDVADTLRQIADIHDGISKFCNTPNLDAFLRPSDWFQSECPESLMP